MDIIPLLKHLRVFQIKSSLSKYLIEERAGFVLPYVLLVAFLITSGIIAFISIITFSNYNTQKEINKKRLDLACYSAVQEYLTNTMEISEGFYSTDIDSVNVNVKHKVKGLFCEITASAKNSIDSSKVIYMIAERLSEPFENAIVISRPNLNVSYAGKNRIIGSILTGTPKITPGTIYGLDVPHEKYLKNKVLVSDEIQIKLFNESLLSVPDSSSLNPKQKINGKLILDETTLVTLHGNTDYIIEGDLMLKGTLIEEYKDTYFRFFVNGKTIISSNTQCNLNMEIFSDSTVTFNENSNIENLLIYCRGKVDVLPGNRFKNVQLMSESDIGLNNSQFDYPSILLMYNKPESKNYLNSELTLESTIVNGAVMLINPIAGLENNQSKIKIDKLSRVKGIVYSENNLELDGSVMGTVYTYSFYYYKEPSVYINWLVNLNINREELDESFLMPCGFSEKPDLEILSERWIY